MRLIDRALQQGKDTIVLVPEIGLTPQVLGLFHQRYGRQVAVLHSGLSIGERNDEYRRADRGEAKIVLGTRSAVFAPLHTLGLIIMDEEQELTYKSERTPRYHARDIARYRAGESGALPPPVLKAMRRLRRENIPFVPWSTDLATLRCRRCVPWI